MGRCFGSLRVFAVIGGRMPRPGRSDLFVANTPGGPDRCPAPKFHHDTAGCRCSRLGRPHQGLSEVPTKSAWSSTRRPRTTSRSNPSRTFKQHIQFPTLPPAATSPERHRARADRKERDDQGLHDRRPLVGYHRGASAACRRTSRHPCRRRRRRDHQRKPHHHDP